MLDNTDAAIITWVRGQILTDSDRLDQVPSGPWAIDLGEAALTSPADPLAKVVPTGYPQFVKPAVPAGMNAEAILAAYDPQGTIPVTAFHVVAAADPVHYANVQQSRAAQLDLCHRLLSLVSNEMVRLAAQQWLRLLAAEYAARPGYNPDWTPGQFMLAPPAGDTAGPEPGTWTPISQDRDEAARQLAYVESSGDGEVETAKDNAGQVIAYRIPQPAGQS